MTTAQLLFSIALGLITLLITFFAIYVVSSTMWGGRWAPGGRKNPRPRTEAKKEA